MREWALIESRLAFGEAGAKINHPLIRPITVEVVPIERRPQYIRIRTSVYVARLAEPRTCDFATDLKVTVQNDPNEADAGVFSKRAPLRQIGSASGQIRIYSRNGRTIEMRLLSGGIRTKADQRDSDSRPFDHPGLVVPRIENLTLGDDAIEHTPAGPSTHRVGPDQARTLQAAIADTFPGFGKPIRNEIGLSRNTAGKSREQTIYIGAT